MYLYKLIVLLCVILNSYYVRSKSSDIIHLRDHFITNLLEENRNKFSMQLTDDIDISRGDMIVRPDNLPYVGQDFEAMICWMSEEPMQINRKYVIKHAAKTVRVMIKSLNYRVNIDTLEIDKTAGILKLNDIGRITVKTMTPLAFDPYERNRYTGGFIIIDEATNITVGAGMICEPRKDLPKREYEGYAI